MNAAAEAAVNLATGPCPSCGREVIRCANVPLEPGEKADGVFGVMLLPGALVAASGPDTHGRFDPHLCSESERA